jgi:hypothetical protein
MATGPYARTKRGPQRDPGVPEDVVMELGGGRTRSMLSRYNVVS